MRCILCVACNAQHGNLDQYASGQKGSSLQQPLPLHLLLLHPTQTMPLLISWLTMCWPKIMLYTSLPLTHYEHLCRHVRQSWSFSSSTIHWIARFVTKEVLKRISTTHLVAFKISCYRGDRKDDENCQRVLRDCIMFERFVSTAGECDLQDQAQTHGSDRTRYFEHKRGVTLSVSLCRHTYALETMPFAHTGIASCSLAHAVARCTCYLHSAVTQSHTLCLATVSLVRPQVSRTRISDP